MQQHDTVIGQELGASLEEGLVEADPDMLEHADGHDAIERAIDIAIVLQQEFRATRQAPLRRATVGNPDLLGRQCDTSALGAGDLSEVEARAAPARADVEQALAWL